MSENFIFGLLSENPKNIITKISIDNSNLPLELCKNEHFSIVTTGSTFEKLYNLNEKFLSEKDQSLANIHRLFRLILKNGIIFTRMSLDHKALLVEYLKKKD